MKAGKVYVAGAGPGDPALLTLRTAELLKSADVIIYDRLVDDRILEMIPSGATKIYAGKGSRGKGALQQSRINRLMLGEAKKGKTVLRLKGGDPMVFGRGGEEIEFLRSRRVPFEVVPGVTSALAGPAMAGIPLTHRRLSSSIFIATGNEARWKRGHDFVDWKKVAGISDSIVILMGAKNFPRIARELISGGLGKEAPVAIIRWAATEKQTTLLSSLGALSHRKDGVFIEPPCVIVVGEVASRAKELDWFEVGGKSTLREGTDDPVASA